MKINNGSVVLVLAPHTDDGELGLGGTIHKLNAAGCEVHYTAFSAAEESIPEEFDLGQTRLEVCRATEVLGIHADNLEVMSFKVRRFADYRQEILDSMIKLRASINPDVVFIPSSEDVHQDHQIIHSEAIRAFKTRTILGYELIWNEFSFHSDLLITLEEEDVRAKVRALSKYETQAGRPYMSSDFILGLARARGVQAGAVYAEAFEVIRCVIN